MSQSDFIFSQIKYLYDHLPIKSYNYHVFEDFLILLESGEFPDYKETLIRPDILKFIIYKKIKPLIKVIVHHIYDKSNNNKISSENNTNINVKLSPDYLRRIFAMGLDKEFNILVKMYYPNDKISKTKFRKKLNLKTNNFEIIRLIFLHQNYEIADYLSHDFEKTLISVSDDFFDKFKDGEYDWEINFWDYFILFVFHFNGSLDLFKFCKNILSNFEDRLDVEEKDSILDALSANARRRNIHDYEIGVRSEEYCGYFSKVRICLGNLERMVYGHMYPYIYSMFILDKVENFNKYIRKVYEKNNSSEFIDCLFICSGLLRSFIYNRESLPYCVYVFNSKCFKILCEYIQKINYRHIYKDYTRSNDQFFIRDVIYYSNDYNTFIKNWKKIIKYFNPAEREKIEQKYKNKSDLIKNNIARHTDNKYIDNLGLQYTCDKGLKFTFFDIFTKEDLSNFYYSLKNVYINILPPLRSYDSDYYIGEDYDSIVYDIQSNIFNYTKLNTFGNIDWFNYDFDQLSLIFLYKLKSYISIRLFGKSINYFHKKCMYNYKGKITTFKITKSGPSDGVEWWNEKISWYGSNYIMLGNLYKIYSIIAENIKKRELILNNFDKCIMELIFRPGGDHYKEGLAMIEEINKNI